MTEGNIDVIGGLQGRVEGRIIGLEGCEVGFIGGQGLVPRFAAYVEGWGNRSTGEEGFDEARLLLVRLDNALLAIYIDSARARKDNMPYLDSQFARQFWEEVELSERGHHRVSGLFLVKVSGRSPVK